MLGTKYSQLGTYDDANAGVWQAHVDVLVFDLLVVHIGLQVSNHYLQLGLQEWVSCDGCIPVVMIFGLDGVVGKIFLGTGKGKDPIFLKIVRSCKNSNTLDVTESTQPSE